MSSRVRKAGLLGVLWASVPAKVVAIAVVLAVTAGSGGDAVNGWGRSETFAADGVTTPGPGQRWGEAQADPDHLEGAPNNNTVPESLRSRYPKVEWDAGPQNAASVVEPPVTEAKGFQEGESREKAEGRTKYEKVYTNPDGSETTEFSAGPVNYRDGDEWKPIETDLVPNDQGWHNAADEVDVQLNREADAEQLAKLVVDADHEVSYGLAGANKINGTAEGSTATYTEVQPGVDLKLESQPGGVKETLVLTRPGATSFTFPLTLKNLTAHVENNQVLLKDDKNTTRAVIPPGDMVDANGIRSTAVTYALTSHNGRPALQLTLDTTWLNQAAYPVAVDPTVQLPVAGEAADSSLYVNGTTSAPGGQTLGVGPNAASYLRFGSLVDKLRNHTIFGAQLWLVNYDSDSCRPRNVTVHPVTESWTSSSDVDYPGPNTGRQLGERSFAHGYIAFGQSSSACPTAGELINLGGGGRDLVQKWVNGEQANNGISLRASGDGSGKKFTGPATANPPRLYVTHSPYNATYALANPVPNPPVLQNQDGKVKIAVTNKSAAAWAPGDYYLAYRAYNATTGASVVQQRSANLTATVNRNQRVTLDATIKALPPGKYFLDFTMVKTGGPVFTDHQVPPGRIVLEVFDIPPVVQELYPPNGYQAPTLTPQLWARALDIDAPPSVNMQFKFEICERDAAGKPINCVNSGYLAKTAWTVPEGTLKWSKAYDWRAYVKDATTEVISPYSTVLTSVPQPEITSRLAGGPYGTKDQEFDPQSGNYSTAAVDASITTAGPELRLVRTYNSLDPRRDGIFGAGWSSRYDMKIVQDDDGSGNVVVTYPDGQQVRFGRNADGTYAAPFGRQAKLTVDTTAWKLLDLSGTTYQFSLTGRLSRITDSANRAVVLTYDNTTGKLLKAHVSNSQTNTSGRFMTFTWTGNRVTSVKADGTTWTYTYTGDLLTKVCSSGCTSYEYTAGSHYRTTVLDSRPESYWRLGEPEGTAAASEIAVNLGKDSGTYKNVTLATPGINTTDTAATFNGTTSAVDLPKGTVKKSRDGAVELWFKNSVTGSGGPLLGYQDKALGSTSTTGVPILYVGTDGKLRGQFGIGAISPITSGALVNDGKWHHVVLSSMGSTQTLFLDGAKVGELTGKTIDHEKLTFNQIGAAYATGAWPAWGTTPQRHYSGVIDEVAIYSGPIGPQTVTAHRNANNPADQLAKITLPSGKVAAATTYDTALDRVKEHTDDNGGTWRVGPPAVYGGDNDLRRTVEVLDPSNRPSLYEYDALGGWLLRLGQPLGLEARSEDTPGEPTSTPTPPTETCSKPDPNDPAFCTVIPDSSGGPVFVRYGAEGMSIRSYSYDDNGQLSVVTDENGDTVTLGYDARGNVTSRKTCRTATECHTSYETFPTTITNEYDPRNFLPLESRDGRSASATDTTYRTSFSYHSTGQLLQETAPDGSIVKHTYTNGAEVAVNGGSPPAALLLSTVDARGRTTRYAYYNNGDLARVTRSNGLITEYTYDNLGRTATIKEISDTFPNGVVTSFTYDAMSRLQTTTGPITTNAVTGKTHQLRTTNTFDADGNVTQVESTDTQGNDPPRVTKFDYDQQNRLVRETDAEGNETSYEYDAFGHRTSETDPNGNRFDFAYTTRGSLAEVRLRDWRSDPAGVPAPANGYLLVKSFSYDFAGRLASETDAMGRRTEFQYWGDGLLRRKVLKDFDNPDGSKRDYVIEDNTYDGAGNLTRTVTGNGKLVTEHTMDRLGRVSTVVVDPAGLRRTTSYTYDAGDNVTRTTTSGKASNVPWEVSATPEIVSYQHDDLGNVIEETVTDGITNRVTKFGYDQRGHQISVTDPRLKTTTYAFDELGRQVTTTGAEVPVERDGGAPTTTKPTTKTGYNTFDEIVAVADELGNVTTAGYDRLGRVVSTTLPTHQAITPTTRTFYDGNGNVTEVVNARGFSTKMSYDQLDRVVTVDEPATTGRAISRFTYTRSGQLLSTTAPDGARTESTYDDLDREITSTQYERKPTTGTFTAWGRYDDLGNVISAVAPSGAAASFTYDTLGQLIKETDPAGVPTHHGYDAAGNAVRVTDGLGRTTRLVYDLFGDQVAQSELKPDGTVLRTTKYGYDTAGNTTTVTDAKQNVTTLEFDAGNRLVKQIEPEGVTQEFGYDAAGNLTRYTDPRGNRTITTYNPWGLQEKVIEPATAAHPTDRTWTSEYDANGNEVKLTAPGGVVRTRTFDPADQLTAETGSGAEKPTTARDIAYDIVGQATRIGSDTYTYDDRGNLLTTAGPGGTAEFGYDADSNPTTRRDAAGTSTYTYLKGRLNTVAEGLAGVTQTFGYDGAGEVKTVGYGAGRTRTFGYDDYSRQISDVLTGSTGQTISSTTYGHDDTDLVTSKTENGVQTGYTYDALGRLKTATTGGVTTAYEWDPAGNRTKAGAKTSTYDERNRLLSDGDYTYTYSARGTLAGRTSSGHTEPYAFDAFDRMVGAISQTYTYDGLDRVSTRNGTAFTYAGQDDQVVSDGTATFARGPGDELLATKKGDAARVPVANGHGDVIGAIAPDGQALADKTSYDAFGKVTAKTGDTGPLGYQGDWTDPATGQVDMGARWYEPTTGGFNARDDIPFQGGEGVRANRYTYGAGDPVGQIDPDGHWSWPWDWGDDDGGDGPSTSVETYQCILACFDEDTSWAIRQQADNLSGKKRKKSPGSSGTYPSYAPGPAYNGSGGGGSCGACYNASAAARAEAARRAEYERKKRVTAQAKAAAQYSARHVPRTVSGAAHSPVTNMPKPVASSPKVPANKVGTSRDVVADAKRGTDKIYDQAVKKAGNPVQNTSKASQPGSSSGSGGISWKWPGWKQAAKDFGSGFVEGLAEFSGYNDAKRCITSGDAESCIWTVVSVASVFAGPYGVGAVRAAKGVRMGAKYADDVVNAACTVVAAADDNSFAGDTPVRMGDGSTKAIGSVRVGDQVTAADPTTGQSGSYAVTDVIVGSGTKELTELTVSFEGRTSTLTTTDGHPFWADGKWDEAGDLVVGQRISEGQIVGTRSWTEQRTVYNLTVDTLHTFHVVTGDADVLVHNAGRCRKAWDTVTSGLGKAASALGRAKNAVIKPFQAFGRKFSAFRARHGGLRNFLLYRPYHHVRNQTAKAVTSCLGNAWTAGVTYMSSRKLSYAVLTFAGACLFTTVKDSIPNNPTK
ncbi:RHS repeat-associated core domain-containing protein [Saccharothrix sp. ALI-22-I]|uniref:RHS repeat-associated core domain-containing protein n=1 Tax=Saccharothrix sp. ALI-22-I TaxID=1933778 RepID=UPI000A008862|nr:RHS repeat-associated core domain-containing protein [Saccharothrix sp. ALI-22-I]